MSQLRDQDAIAFVVMLSAALLSGCQQEPIRPVPQVVATWVVTRGGVVELKVQNEPGTITVSQSDELPQARYRIEAISFADVSGLVSAEIANLTDLNTLKKLDLSGSDITDEGMQHLTGLTRLSNLNISGTVVGNSGLRPVGQLQELKTLNASWLLATDDGLAHLKPLWQLRKLDLSSTSVTSVGVLALKANRNLEQLNLRDTKVLESAIGEIQETFYQCEILYGSRDQ